MSTTGPSSSHPGGEPQPVNPYAASQIADGNTEPALDERGEQPRHFRGRMDWADRRAFLRSVGPTRVAAVFGGLLYLNTVYTITKLWTRSPTFDQQLDWYDAFFFTLTIIAVGNSLLSVYVCWLNWGYAEMVRRVAGGATANMTNWSRLHYRIEWLSATAYLINLGYLLVDWLMVRALFDDFLPA